MRIADHIETAEPANADSTVFKAIQTDGIFTAVYVFPFRLPEEQLIYFNEQVELLGEAYVEFRAAIPRVLSHGFTKTGSFPFIETEWINGITLDALIKRNYLFTVDSIINIAEEVSRTMAYCHKLGILHGDINSNNISWEEKLKRYVVTGFRFGLSTSGVYARSRSVAVIAPGQKNDLRSKLDDVQDIGNLLWQLLKTKMNGYEGEKVDGVNWQDHSFEFRGDLKEKAEKIPAWLVTCIQKAMGVDKEKNFENAVQLYGYILSHHKIPFQKKDWYRSKPQSFSVEQKRTLKKFRFPRKKIQPRLKSHDGLQRKIKKLRFVFDRNIGAGLIVAILLLGFSIYAQKKEQRSKTDVAETGMPPVAKTSASTTDTVKKEQVPKKAASDTPKKQPEIKTAPAREKTVVVPGIDSTQSTQTDSVDGKDLGSYKVRSRAYFHNAPDETTRRNAFIVHWNNAVLHPLKEEGEFIYIVFTNHLGQTSRGWLRKQDLIRQ